jgi:hypothetical protein
LFTEWNYNFNPAWGVHRVSAAWNGFESQNCYSLDAVGLKRWP